MWDMQKIIIKAGPTAQLAQHCHATREQVFLSLTPGAFVGLGKGLGNVPASPCFPGTSTLQAMVTLQSRGRPALISH